MADWISYTNQGATRNQPLSEQLQDALSYLPSMGVTMDVFSGGQDASGPNRVGSHRHDNGNAGDVFFSKDGRRLDWSNPDDQHIFEEIVRRGKEAGVTGFGAGDGYMQPGSMHIGFGEPSVWGAGGKGANAPAWLKSAYFGTEAPPVMRAATPAKPANWLSALVGGGVNSALDAIKTQAAPIMRKAEQAGPAAFMQAMGTLEGRSAIGRYLTQMNVAKAPTMVPGFQPGGSQVMAVNNHGSSPATLMRATDGSRGGVSSQAFDNRYHSGQNMDVYRANTAAVGGGGNLNQAGINAALMRGATLVRGVGGGNSGGQSLSTYGGARSVMES